MLVMSYGTRDGTRRDYKLRINVLDLITSYPHWHTLFYIEASVGQR